MIIKLYILIDNKLTINNFILSDCITKNNILKLNSINNLNNNELIKIPICNIYNGVDYETIQLPLEFIKLNNKYIFNPYLILSSYNSDYDNDIDFFYQLNKMINNIYHLSFISFNNISNNYNLINLYQKYYINIINDNIKLYMNNLQTNINIIKTIYIYYNIIKFNKNNIMVFNYNLLNKFKYKLIINSNLNLTLINYINYNYNTSLKLCELLINNNYYIINNNILKYITISNIIDNNIYDNNNIIIYNNYKWYNHNPNINIDLNYIIYNTFINKDIDAIIITHLINIKLNESLNIIKYYNNNYLLCYLKNIIYLDDMDILKSNSYDLDFFKYITEKYSNNINDIINILTILFNNYTYPLTFNKHDLDDIFDYILYFSLYNYKIIIIKNYIINNKINNIIPTKLKSLFINIYKLLIQIINEEYNYIIYNQKLYNDYLHRNIIKLFFYNTNKLSIIFFKNTISNENYNKFKNIITTNMLLYDLSYKLSWSTLSKKLNYLKLFYINKNIIYYQDKINKNIIFDNIDIKIKKIIENPFEMYKHIKYEKDFIKWTKFISNYIITIYNIPITIYYNDIINIGKIIYLLFNIKEQNLKDISYNDLIIYCKLHHKLILDIDRINIKIKDFFPNLKFLNLGILSKHILLYSNNILN